MLTLVLLMTLWAQQVITVTKCVNERGGEISCEEPAQSPRMWVGDPPVEVVPAEAVAKAWDAHQLHCHKYPRENVLLLEDWIHMPEPERLRREADRIERCEESTATLNRLLKTP